MTGRPLDVALRRAVRELTAAGVPSPEADATALIAHITGRTPAEVTRARILGERLASKEESTLDELVARRRQRIPLQHLTGRAHLAGVDLRVGPGVFVPRPETEVLVALALAEVDRSARPDVTVVDLCTGSGAIALAVAAARPRVGVHGVELSPDAARYARSNAEELLTERGPRPGGPVRIVEGRAQEACEDLIGGVDVVTVNPPYIPPDAVPVDLEVRDHDPELALYGGGEDGLAVPLEIAARALELLRPEGLLLMEHADVQGESLPAALRAMGWVDVVDHVDLNGRPRVTAARRPRG